MSTTVYATALAVLDETDDLVFSGDALHTNPATAGLRATTPATSVLDACLTRRPGYDEATGRVLPGAVETIEAGRAPCTLTARHDGEHRDCLDRTWPRSRPVLPVAAQIANLMDETIREAYRPAGLPPLTPRAVAVLVEIAEMRAENQDKNYDRFLSYLAALIWKAGDSTAVLAECADLISAVRVEAGQ